MTNEELVTLIRRGQHDCMSDLYAQNLGMIRRIAFRYSAMQRSPAVDIEDFMQTGYLALAAAVDGYDEEQSAFISYLVLCLRSFMRRLIGLDGAHKPHFLAASLDEEIPGSDGDTTRGDLVPDEAAEDPCKAAELSETQRTIRDAVDRLPENQRKAICSLYFDGQQYAETSDGFETTKRNRSKGISKLRRDFELRRLWELYERPLYRHVTLSSFNATWDSTVELAAIDRDRIKARLADLQPKPY